MNSNSLVNKQKQNQSNKQPNKKIVGQFPDWTVLRLTLPRGEIPDGYIHNQTIPQLGTSPTETSPTGHLPDHIIFSIFQHFLVKHFVKASGLDFPLFFFWLIILSIFIYTQLIYKRFNLLNIACQCSAIIFSQKFNSVHQCRSENFLTCFCPYKSNNTLKISHY